MTKVEKISQEIMGCVLSAEELDNLLAAEGFYPLENDSDDEVIRYTNYKYQIWMAEKGMKKAMSLVTEVTRVTKSAGQTRVDPFHTFNDLCLVLSWFWENGKFHHWLAANLMVAFGRRVGDTLGLRWGDLYLADGTLRDKLNTLVEQKTGKIVGVKSNPYAADVLKMYCGEVQIIPEEHLTEKIFDITAAAFRKATKDAVKAAGLTYPVSTHSYRKFYANMIYKLHQQDADALSIVQSMMGHSDPNITKMYIGVIDEKIERYNQDYAQYLIDCTEGKEVAFNNSPVVVMTMENMREILAEAYRCGRSAESDSLEDMNKLLAMVDERRIS